MTETKNSEKFIFSFNSIEKELKNKYNIEEYVGFTSLIRDVARKNHVIDSNLRLLESYASLRNAIVHNEGKDFTIAEPHIQVVEKIQKIEELILNPPKVIPTFQRDVLILQSTYSIFPAIKRMFENNFSQVPIVESNKFIGLLNANTITRWFGGTENKKIDEDGNTMIIGTHVKDVLDYTENNNSYKFVNREYYLQDILEMFEKDKNIEAILITHSGSEDEKILGIITIWDLVEINNLLSN